MDQPVTTHPAMDLDIMNTPTLTVLICTHNRAPLLERTLLHLISARRPDEWSVDILVVVNACTDNSIECIENIKARNKTGPAIRWIEERTPGKSNALNRAMSLIDSDLVAFVDDDHRIDPDYLVKVCLAADQYADAGMFCGRILPDWDGSEPSWVHDTGPYRIYPLPVPRFDQGDMPRLLTPETAIPGGGNLIIRGALLGQVGAFSTELGPTGHDLGGSEDLDWVLRAQNLGARLQYVPSIVQYHYVDTGRFTIPYLIKKSFRRSSATVGIRNTPNGRIPLYLYRKLGRYLVAVLTSVRNNRRRFYLVRTAAALGEMHGHRRRTQITSASGLGAS